jgi:hypothetical protein
MSDKIREQRLRRAAERQGLSLTKSRRRDPRAVDYGGYMLVVMLTNAVVAGGHPWPYSLDLDEVEHELERGQQRRRARLDA